MKKLQVLFAAILTVVLAGGVAFAQSGYDLFQKALAKERAEGKLEEAIQLYKQVVREHAGDRTLAAKALVQMGRCYEKLGNVEAQKAYERVVRDYADQPEAAEARARLAALTEPSRAVPASAVLARRITDDAMVDSSGTPSSDGRFLSTTDWGTGDVAVIDVATGQKRLVTNKGSWSDSSEFSMFPVVSPDGKRIAYSWWGNKASRFDLRVIDTDGTSPRVLLSSEEMTESWPTAWTPDGNSILVFIDRADRTGQIALVSATDGKVRVLKTLPSGRVTYKASISPDGRYVAYDYPSKEDSPEHDIFLLPIEGGGEVPLVRHAANDFSPLWAPDGQSVVFVSDRTGSLGLWRIRVAGGKPQGPEELLRLDVGTLFPIGFSAKGSFFYGLATGLVDVYQATLDLATGKVTAAPAPVSQRYTGNRAGPHWSPDGKSLVYISTRGPFSPMLGFHTLSIFSPETGRERELPLNLTRIGRVRWSPDAREFLITAKNQQGRGGLFRVDARTGETTPIVLAEPRVDLRWSRWSPDGKSVFFVRYDAKKLENTIVERNLQSGEEKEFGRYTLPDAYVAGFDLSPDGQQILLYLTAKSFGGTFTLIPVAGGQPRDLYRLEPTPYSIRTNPFWTPDGKNILFFHRPGQPTDPQPAPNEVWRVSVETGKAEKLDLPMQGLSYLTIHPDGKRVAFAAGESKSEIWVMENIFPAPTLTVPASAVLSRRITDDAMDVDELGTPSSDGRFLSTTDWDTGDLAVIDVATGQMRRLTNKGSWAENPIEMAEFTAVSPDGKRIVYGWLNKSKRYELRVIDVEGKSPRVLCSSEELPGNWPRPTAWTPDGKWVLVFVGRSDGTDQLALVSADDGKVRILKTLPFGFKTSKASISPDGRYVAYAYPSKEDSPERDIFLVPIEGGGEVPLIRHPADDFSPLWAPDGQSVIFASNRTVNPSLWRIRVAGGKPQGSEELLRADAGRISPMGFSAKGSFFYSLRTGQADVYLTTLDVATGKVTAAPVPVSQGYARGRYAPHWSPDGKSLLYVTWRGDSISMLGQYALSIFSPETRQERELPLNLRQVMWFPHWSPDAREILVTAVDAQGRQGLFRVDARTGEATPAVLAEAGTALGYSSWSPDGKSVCFVRPNRKDDEDPGTTLIQRNLQSGEEKVLARYSGLVRLWGFEFSPDGQQIVMYLMDRATSSTRFAVIPAAGGQPRDVYQVRLGLSSVGFFPIWTPDGKYMLFVLRGGDTERGPSELWRLSVETGKAEKLGLAMEGLSSVTLHPDGKHLAFGARLQNSEIWVMENLLPAPPRAAK